MICFFFIYQLINKFDKKQIYSNIKNIMKLNMKCESYIKYVYNMCEKQMKMYRRCPFKYFV